MRSHLRPSIGALGVAALCLGLILAGCGRGDAPQQDTSQQDAQSPEASTALRPVALPSLDGFEDAARVQLQDRYAQLEALAKNAAPDTTLGAAHGALGQLLMAYDLNDAAEPALLNAAALMPGEARWPYYLGYLYKRKAQPTAAAPRFERALALQPDDVPTRVHLAEAYRDLDRAADAQDLLRKALDLDPSCAQAFFLLGQMAGDPSQAIAHYEKVLQLQPAASSVHYPLGQAYRDQGNMERSRYHLDRRGTTPPQLRDPLMIELERLREGSNSKMYVAQRFMEQRMYQQAALVFAEVVAEDPDNADAYLGLGAAHGQAGNLEKAMEAIEEAVRLDPGESRSHYNLAILYVTKGDVDKALEHFRTAVEINPGNTDAHLALARIHWRHRRCREAMPHFETYLAASPDNVEARINQAICHVDLGEYAEAKALLEAGFEAFPQHPGLQDALVRVLAASADDAVRDGQRALAMAETLSQAFTRTETLESLAMAFAEQKRFPQAVQAQRMAIQAAQQQGLTTWLAHLNANLNRYQQQQPCRAPWERVIFEK